MPVPIPLLPAASKSRIVLLAGLGTLLALLGSLGWYAARALGRLNDLAIDATSQFIESSKCIENSRRLFLESSGFVRDNLLELPSADPLIEEGQARQAWRQANENLDRCWQAGRNAPEAAVLDQQLSGYWALAEEGLRRTRNGTREARLDLLRHKLIPLRDRILTSFDVIIAEGREEMLRLAESRAVTVRSEVEAVWIAVGAAGILSLAVAMLTYTRMVKLQESSAALYQNAVRASTELERLSERLFHVQEEERRRIAADLHDDFGQRMASLLFEISNTARDGAVSPELRGRMEATGERLRTLSKDLQAMSRGLHSAVLDKIGLEAAVRSECETLSRSGMATGFHAANVPRRLPDNTALTMYRVFQEAAQNAVKHSGADRLDVWLEIAAGEVVLRVQDFGKGFDSQSPAGHAGLGMISMRERLRIAGGALSITSGPGKGALVEARIPLQTPARKGDTLTARDDAAHNSDRG
ncbi:MAG: sensor histidine kinase [Bryobacterales bacterium]|nr:sensor histidine kinase [Bryobacterales bacterium]